MTRFQYFMLVLGAVVALGLLAATPGMAVQPDEVLDDPELEARARVISQDIRCLVCQNQSIDDSNADLARDLRIIVRERLVEGDTDREVKEFLVERYGDYVLLTPPLNIGTMLLWIGPFLLVAIGGAIILMWYRSRHAGGISGGAVTASARALSTEEEARIQALMSGDDGPDEPGDAGSRPS